MASCPGQSLRPRGGGGGVFVFFVLGTVVGVAVALAVLVLVGVAEAVGGLVFAAAVRVTVAGFEVVGAFVRAAGSTEIAGLTGIAEVVVLRVVADADACVDSVKGSATANASSGARSAVDLPALLCAAVPAL